MKSLSLVLAALAGASAFTLAAAAQAQPAGPDDWSGMYIGVNSGWNRANVQALPSQATTQQLTGLTTGAGPVTVPPATFSTPRMDFSSSGWAAGGQIGVNHQMGRFVLGLEADGDGVTGHAQQFSSYTLPGTALTNASPVGIDRYARPEWTSTVRGRAGVALGPVLFYGTGGLAIAGMREGAYYTYTPSPTGVVVADNPGYAFGEAGNYATREYDRVGWTAGGGAELRLTRDVSIGAEYRHSDYGHEDRFVGSNGPEGVAEASRIGFSNDQVLAKLNFRFGPGF